MAKVVRTYTFAQDGFISGNEEYLYGNEMIIMVADVVYPGTWYVRLSTNQTPTEKTSVTAKLIEPFVWEFATDTDIQNGYIVNTGVSFSERAMPTVTGGGGTSFYANHAKKLILILDKYNFVLYNVLWRE